MQTLEKEVYMELKALAKERGVTVQELLRAVVVPDWMRVFNGGEHRSGSRSRSTK
jgi:predicted DNA-binding ribbon-helix-helix protein